MEIHALVDVRRKHVESDMRRWAFERADFYNANFRHEKHHPEAFTIEDFLGSEDKNSWNERIRQSAKLRDKAHTVIVQLNGVRSNEDGSEYTDVGVDVKGLTKWLESMKFSNGK